MASVLNKTSGQYLTSVHTPDYPTADWFINPDISAVQSVPTKYWRIGINPVQEMDAGEKAAVDAAQASAAKTSAKSSADSAIDGNGGYDLRAIAKLTIDEINTLRQWLASFKTETAAATNLANFQTRVASLPATPDRTLAQAKTAYKNLIEGASLDE
jgi:hypothetical protein